MFQFSEWKILLLAYIYIYTIYIYIYTLYCLINVEFYIKCTNKFSLICCSLKMIGLKHVSIIKTLLFHYFYIIIFFFTFIFIFYIFAIYTVLLIFLIKKDNYMYIK